MTDAESPRSCEIRLHRRILKRGALHPIQVLVLRLVCNPADPRRVAEEILEHKVLLRTDGSVRTLRVAPGRYVVRAREVPLGCTVQGEEIVIECTPEDATCVVLRVGTFMQVTLAGFGGCLHPRGFKAFLFEQVSPEALSFEVQAAPKMLEKVLKEKQPAKDHRSHPS